MEELWDVKDVARYLKLSERTVYQKTRAGELPALRVGGRWRFRPADVEAWLAPSTRYRPAEGRGILAAHEGTRVHSREDLEQALEAIEDRIERRLVFVALLSEACVALAWQAPVVVGGHALEFYTDGAYATTDIDLVSAHEPLERILGDWRFEREGRHWYDEALGLVVEAPASSLGPGQRQRSTAVRIAGHVAYVLSVEDLIVDRLAACVHSSSEDDCRWAGVLLERYLARLDLAYLRERAVAERVGARLDESMGPRGEG